jgi:predicted negative regulator of RcsB-dependent stress response
MVNVKKFLKDNKKEIIVGAVVGVTAVALTSKYYKGSYHLISKACACISWKPTGKFITLEDAKAALDLNGDNASTFAIVKTGKDYAGIILNGGNGFVQP